VSDGTKPLSAENAERLRDAWRAVSDLMHRRPGPLNHDPDYRARVAGSLAALVAKLVSDNIALESHADRDDPAVLAAAIDLADREAALAEAQMLDSTFLLPPGSGGTGS
jgi:hypothetical protein